MKLVLISLLIFSTSLIVNSQNFDNYQPIRSSGNVPNDFTERTSSKVAKDVTDEVSTSDSYKTKNSKSEFLLKANYMIDELLMSGKVLFGDEVSIYVNKIADKLLENDKELRSKLRFYVLKSNVTNAFATNQGMIFVTLGLISQIETEAQLAFVLAHEIIHYKQKHLISTVLEADKAQAQGNRSYYKNYDDNIEKLSKYSRRLETESDSLGFFIMENAGYNLNAALGVFDVLQFSYLPFEEEEFNYSILESENFKLPKKYILDTIVPIKFEYDEDDSKSTHPSLNKRRDVIKALIEGSSKKGVDFSYSKDEFLKIRNISRFETVRLNLKNGSYARAFYNVSILIKQFPNSVYLKKSYAKALYGIAKYHSINKYHLLVDDYTEYEGNISSVFYMFEKMESKDVLALSLRNLWIIYQDTNDSFIMELIKNLMYDMSKIEKVSADDFFKELPIKSNNVEDKVKEKDTVSAITSATGGSKYDKIKAIKSQTETKESLGETDNSFYKTILYDLKNKEEFLKLYKSTYLNVQKELDSIDIVNKKYDHLSPRAKGKAIENDRMIAYKDKIESQGKLGTEKIVFIDPEFFTVDERQGVKLVNSEDKKYEFYDQINLVSKAANMDNEVLSPKLFSDNDADKFNDLVLFNEWSGERMRLDGVKDGWNFIPLETEFIKESTKKYGTNFISYSGVVTYKYKKRYRGLIALGIFIPYTSPFCLNYVVSPLYESIFYNFIYDTNTGQKVVEKIYYNKAKLSHGQLNSYFYDMLTLMKKTK
jgi:hypothetical protein